MINDKIWNWFDSAHIIDALIGGNKYFIPDVTFREKHDLLLIIRQLLLWAKTKNEEIYAASEFEKCIDILASINDLEKTLELIQSYLLVCTSDNITLPINEMLIADKISRIINDNYKVIVNNEDLVNFITSVTKLWPMLARQVGLEKK